MKLRLNKLMAGLVMAGGALALVGCGGGDAPTLKPAASSVVQTITATNTTAVAAAKTTVAAFGATGADFKIAAVTAFDGSTTTIPANSTLTLAPSTNTAAIADFTIKAPNTTKTVTGVVLPGSCKFEVTGPVDTAQLLDGYTLGQIYTIGTCSLTIPTTTVGSAAPVTPSITLASNTIPAEKTITVTINDNGSITASIPSTTPGGAATTVTLAPAGTVALVSGT